MKSVVLILVLCAGLLGIQKVLEHRSMGADREGERNAHFRIVNPAELGPTRAEAIYQSIRQSMAARYGESGDPLTDTYQGWARINRFPYRSVAHGGLFVNNYANSAGGELYAARSRATPFPQESIIVKDSFMVTRDGQVLTGPLYIIEKLSPGASIETGDWRFLEIEPDGSLIGAAPGDRRTHFCAGCHVKPSGAVAPFFFVPRGIEAGENE